MKLPPTADDPLNIAGYPDLQSRHPCCQHMQRLGQELCRFPSWRRRKKNKYPNFSGGVYKRQPLYIQGRWKRAKSFETMSRAQCTNRGAVRFGRSYIFQVPEHRNQPSYQSQRHQQYTSSTHTSQPRSESGNGITHTSHHIPPLKLLSVPDKTGMHTTSQGKILHM